MTHILTILSVMALLGACTSGGDETGGGTGATVSITTLTLDQGNVDKTFFQQILATGGRQPYTWWVSASGDALPDGLAMTPDGRIAGSPTSATSASVVVVVQDTNSALDLVTLSIEVRDVEIAGATGESLPFGAQLQLQAAGGAPGYAFSFSSNQSGAQLTGNGDYTAGQDSGIDVVRATDLDGFYEEISVTVGDNPFVGFKARFGASDVWFVDWNVVYDPAPTYATDLDDVLATLGLRDPASTGSPGTPADQLARLLVIRRTVGHLATFFGNNFDGTELPGGAAISFPAPAAPAGTTPGAGGVTSAQPGRYNTICVRWGPSSGVVGTAWLDETNDSIEHDCGTPAGTHLGVFANRILPSYLSRYQNAISNNPVTAADLDALNALLQGSAPANARETAIFDLADKFGRALAAVLAHEIGHSLGLNHSGTGGEPASSGPGDLMNATLSMVSSYSFNAGHWATLMSDLPGPNR